MTKMARQPTVSVRPPPTTGPSAEAPASTVDMSPMAVPRRRAPNTPVTSTMAAGLMMPEPTPWTPRATIRIDRERSQHTARDVDEAPADDHPPGADEVHHPPRRDEDHGRGEEVDTRDPLDGAGTATEIISYGRERDGDDGAVEGQGGQHQRPADQDGDTHRAVGDPFA